MNFIIKAGFIAAAGLLLTACSSHSTSESQGGFTDGGFSLFGHSQKNLESPKAPPIQAPVPGKNYQVSRTADAANDVMITAMGLVGTPYRWGGDSEAEGVDCSGLLVNSFQNAIGMKLPRRSIDMSRMQGKVVPKDKLKTGDLVFFSTNARRKEINHVGLYVGDGRFVHAPRTGRNVELSRLDSAYWQKTFREAKRVITPQALRVAQANVQ
jgi:cell wall-associated NlpC family hydrolase